MTASFHWWQELAQPVAANGFNPVAVLPCSKVPRLPKWEMACIVPPNPTFIERHACRFGADSVGIACGALRDDDGKVIGYGFLIDPDEDDPVRAAALDRLVVKHLGETPLVRIGRPNRRARFYRCATPIQSIKTPRKLEVLGKGRQFVAFGLHPATGHPYSWPGETPVTIRASEVPLVTWADVKALVTELGWRDDRERIAQARPARSAQRKRPFTGDPVAPRHGYDWRTNSEGCVVDGRDAFLTCLVTENDADAERAWELFAAHADLARPKRDGRRPWGRKDAEDKASYLKRRKSQGRVTGGRGRPRMTPPDRCPWSEQEIEAFKREGERLVIAGKLSPSCQKVHAAMADFLVNQGRCWASAETVAKLAGVSIAVVKKARQALVRLLWRSPRQTGRTAVYFPAFKPAQPLEAANEKAAVVPIRLHYSTSVYGVAVHGERGSDERAPSNDNANPIKVPARPPRQLDLFRGAPIADPLQFGRRLRDERQRLGLSQRALADRIGSSQPHIANAERGHDRVGGWLRLRLHEAGVRL
jgi:hypothetical protein